MNRLLRFGALLGRVGIGSLVFCTSMLHGGELWTPQPNEHLCLVGNTLADRMQHDGWLETAIQHDFPEQRLVIRNLGFSGDELTLRLRSSGFGSPDDHLSFNRADVILAFFGYNESFGGTEGLAKFRQDLREFVQHTLAQQYNGSSAPRLLLCSPIAHEDLGNVNLPDGSENNARLALYTQAMAEIAAEEQVGFIDLFQPTQAAYVEHAEPLTINGIHLNEAGNRVVAEIIRQALWPDATPIAWDADGVEQLRSEVLRKNFYWFNRYRTTDGYSIYGGRADLRFVDGQTNRVVMQREMEVLDALTANRDQAIWAAASGTPSTIDLLATPEFIPVVTNKPGEGPNGGTSVPERRGRDRKMTVARRNEGEPVCLRRAFPGTDQPGADGVRSPGAAVGRRLADAIRTGSPRRRWTTSC